MKTADSKNPSLPPERVPGLEVGQVFQHVNGMRYLITAFALQNDEEPPRDVVIHEGLHDGRIWVRSAENFTGVHQSGVRRFTLVETD